MGCLDGSRFDLDGIRSRIGSVAGALRRGDHLSGRTQIRLDEVVLEDLPVLIAEVERLGAVEARLVQGLAARRKALELLRVDCARLEADGFYRSSDHAWEQAGLLEAEITMLERMTRGA